MVWKMGWSATYMAHGLTITWITLGLSNSHPAIMKAVKWLENPAWDGGFGESCRSCEVKTHTCSVFTPSQQPGRLMMHFMCSIRMNVSIQKRNHSSHAAF